LLLAACLLCASTSAQADVLLLDAIQSTPPNDQSGIQRPRSGASMDSVRAAYGEPTSTMEAVGDPPITRWVYPQYTVYFEYDRVIEVVVHR
jgi:hypothetical protein